tara:strand:- start:372 stop:1529 length:1158 start_codon:yes stop_codon:yes gene_type:complete
MQLSKSIRKITLATAKILLVGVLLLFTHNSNATSIGEIVESTGNGQIVREAGNSISLSDIPAIELNDTAETSNGRMLIEFLDKAELSLTEHTKVYIDKVYYDPDPSKSKMTMRMALGTARFASGRLGMVNKNNIDIQTPTASIAVRGTDFTTTIDELGRSLVILLPDQYGNPSGEITVFNDGGTITLNEAYAATMVSSLDSPPTRQITMSGITASMIDNMFIVSPPPEVKEALDEQLADDMNADQGLLDIDFLEFDGLDVDYLEDDALEFSELDIDYLNVDFLTDVLNVVEALVSTAARLDDSAISQSSLGAEIKGADFGLNTDSQYNVYEQDGKIFFFRSVNETIQIILSINARATIRTSVSGYEGEILLNGGADTIIELRQGG